MVVMTSRAAPSAPKVGRGREDEREQARVATPHERQRQTTDDKPLYLQEGFREIEERRQEAERRAKVAEQNLGGMQKQLGDALTKIKDLEARLAVKDSETETNGAEIRSIRDELKATLEKLNKADLENVALRERMNLRQREFESLQQKVEKSRAAETEIDELKTKLAEAERRATEMVREIERLEAELDSTKSSFHMTKLSEALREFDTPDEAEGDEAPAQPTQPARPDPKAPVSLRDRLRRNAPEKVR
jgi:chromosome segregation ATPase